MPDDAACTIHVVDDDPAMLHSLTWLIGSLGLAVEAYPSGESFLAGAPVERPGCLVTDMRMPGMSGLELQERLARAGSPLAVIVITGHGDVPMAVRALRAGAIDFIEKPFNDQVLLERVREALEKSARTWSERRRETEIARRLARLSARERQVAERVVAGKPNKVVAAELNLSPKTVEVHRHNLMEKLGVASLAELTRLFLESARSSSSGT